MHELALAEEIVAASLQAVADHGGGRLERVHVVVRDDDHLTPHILREAYTMAATGTDAEGSVLNIEVPPDLCEGCAADASALNAAVAVTAIDIDV